MEKVEKYIQEHTKETSSPIIDWDGNIAIYQPWLTPKDARKVAEIARKETIKEVCEWIETHLNDDYISTDEESVRMGCPYSYLETNLFIENLKKHLEGKK